MNDNASQPQEEVDTMPEPNFDDGLHIEKHRDGSLRAKGLVKDGRPDGYWEWFVLTGPGCVPGSFAHGQEVGEWTTYDRTGAIHKVTPKR